MSLHIFLLLYIWIFVPKTKLFLKVLTVQGESILRNVYPCMHFMFLIEFMYQKYLKVPRTFLEANSNECLLSSLGRCYENFRGLPSPLDSWTVVLNLSDAALLTWLLTGKESTCQCRKHGFDPCIRKICWRRKWQPTPVFLPGKSHGQRSLVDYSPKECRLRHNWACTNALLTGFKNR